MDFTLNVAMKTNRSLFWVLVLHDVSFPHLISLEVAHCKIITKEKTKQNKTKQNKTQMNRYFSRNWLVFVLIFLVDPKGIALCSPQN